MISLKLMYSSWTQIAFGKHHHKAFLTFAVLSLDRHKIVKLSSEEREQPIKQDYIIPDDLEAISSPFRALSAGVTKGEPSEIAIAVPVSHLSQPLALIEALFGAMRSGGVPIHT